MTDYSDLEREYYFALETRIRNIILTNIDELRLYIGSGDVEGLVNAVSSVGDALDTLTKDELFSFALESVMILAANTRGELVFGNGSID